MNDLLELIAQKHSVRVSFQDLLIETEDPLQVLKAARWSPTAHSMQNFEIVVADAVGNLPTVPATPAVTTSATN